MQRWPVVKAPALYESLQADITNMELSPCGTLCAVGTSVRRLCVFDTTTAEQVVQLTVDYRYVTKVAFSRCGKWLACALRGSIFVYCTSTWECLHSLRGHAFGVHAVSWTHCGRVVSGSRDYTIRVWNVGEGVCTAVLRGHTRSISTSAVSHTTIFSGSIDCTIRVWDLTDLSHTGTLNHMGAVNDITLSSDEKQLVACSPDKVVKVWCTATLQCIWQKATETIPERVAVSQEGDLVAVGHMDSTHLYTLSTGDHVGAATKASTPASPVALSPCGRWLFTVFARSVRITPVSEVPPPP